VNLTDGSLAAKTMAAICPCRIHGYCGRG